MAEARHCGDGFSAGFLAWRESGEFADCVVVGPDGRESACHQLLLAYHSDFFRSAFLQRGMREGHTQRLELRFEDPFSVWPTLLDYFYTAHLEINESNAMGLLNLAKCLMVAAVEEAAREFIKERLEAAGSAASAMGYLRQAVLCEDVELQEACTRLAAQGFHAAYRSDTSGFPPHVLLGILAHLELEVQCEEQVLEFVLRYVRSTQLPPECCRELFQQVRWAYLPERLFAALQAEPCVPRDLLAEGALGRLSLMALQHTKGEGSGGGSSVDTSWRQGCGDGPAVMHWMVSSALQCGDDEPSAEASRASSSISAPEERLLELEPTSSSDSACCTGRQGGCSTHSLPCSPSAGAQAARGQPSGPALPPPRPTYCSRLVHGLPGGCRYVDLPCEHVWDVLAECIRVQASGVREGRPRNVLSEEVDAFFSTNEGEALLPPWVELHMPSNVTLLSLSHYSFVHGHNRHSYYKMRSWKTQAGSASSTMPGSTFVDLEQKWESCVHMLARQSPAREHFTVTVLGPQPPVSEWRVMRLVSTGTQQDGVRRLCLRALRLFGIVRVDLMKQAEGLVMNRQLLERVLAAVGSDHLGNPPA